MRLNLGGEQDSTATRCAGGGQAIPRWGYHGARRLPDGVDRSYVSGLGTWKGFPQGAGMRIEELIVGVLLLVAMASYGFVAAITLLT
jgi:hypothetical protein